MRAFTVFRKGDLSETHSPGTVNPPDMPQFQGVVFDDGRVAVRWLTAYRSVSVWDSMDDLMAVHGHPEPRYGTFITWRDIDFGGLPDSGPTDEAVTSEPHPSVESPDAVQPELQAGLRSRVRVAEEAWGKRDRL